MKLNVRILVALISIAVSATMFFGASSVGLAAGQGSSKQSRAARRSTGATDNQSSRVTKRNRSCKQVCADNYDTCNSHAQPFPFNDWGQPGGCMAIRAECVQECPSNQKQRKPQHLPRT